MIRAIHHGSGYWFFYPSRIQGSKRHRIPDPDKQHWKEFKVVKGAVNIQCRTKLFRLHIFYEKTWRFLPSQRCESPVGGWKQQQQRWHFTWPWRPLRGWHVIRRGHGRRCLDSLPALSRPGTGGGKTGQGRLPGRPWSLGVLRGGRAAQGAVSLLRGSVSPSCQRSEGE